MPPAKNRPPLRMLKVPGGECATMHVRPPGTLNTVKTVGLEAYGLMQMKLLSLLIISALISPWFTQLAHSSVEKHQRSDIKGHYCRVSNGPCRHGETCPLRHLHPEYRHSRDHVKTGHKANEVDRGRIANRCHDSSNTPLNKVPGQDLISLIPQPLTLPREEPIGPLALNGLIQYRNTFPRTLYRPPEAIRSI